MSIDWKNEVVLITSGSYEGVSKVIAETAKQKKAKVVIVARSREIQKEQYKEIDGMLFFPYDFQDLQNVSDLYEMIVYRANAIPTLLINDIRFQISGFITDTPLEAMNSAIAPMRYFLLP